MANPTGPLTLSQMAASQLPKFIKGTLNAFAMETELADFLPWRNTGGAWAVTVPRINPDNQPKPMYRALNGDFNFISGDLENITEGMVPLGGAIKIDVDIQNDPRYQFNKPGPTQVEFVTKQMARELMDHFVNGDPTVVYGTDGSANTVYRVAGIRYRLANPTKFGMDTSTSVNAALDLTTITSSVANSLVDLINDMIDLVDPDIMLCNYVLYRLIKRAFRIGNLLMTTKDSYNRSFDTYDGKVKMLRPKLKTASRTERNVADTTNWILPYEDNTGALTPTAGAGSQYGSIFFGKLGEDALCGLTPGGMQQEGPVKALPPTRAYLYDMQYGCGFMTNGFRDIGRVYNLKIG